MLSWKGVYNTSLRGKNTHTQTMDIWTWGLGVCDCTSVKSFERT